MEPTPSPSCPPDTPRAGILPVILASLVAAADDARGFRRYPLALEVGVRLDAEYAPHRRAAADGRDQERPGLCYRSVYAQDLSLTGLYFVSALPYREGVRVEVRVPLPGLVLNLPAVVRRLDAPARTARGRLDGAFGCAVDFQHQETSAHSRRALMEYLVRRTILT